VLAGMIEQAGGKGRIGSFSFIPGVGRSDLGGGALRVYRVDGLRILVRFADLVSERLFLDRGHIVA